MLSFLGQKNNISRLHTISSGPKYYSTQDVGFTNFCFWLIFFRFFYYNLYLWISEGPQIIQYWAPSRRS
jgi:hypothetical protein